MNNFQALMHHSIDAMFAIDGKQRVIFWNKACESLTGISAEQAMDKSCHKLLHGEDPSGTPYCRENCPLGQLALGGPPPTNFAMRISGRDKVKIQLNVDTLLVPSPVDREWMVVHVLRRGRCRASASLLADSNPGRRSIKARPQRAPAETSPNDLCLLSEREQEVLCSLTHGLSTEAIAEQLHISTTTVRNHIQRLMAKLNVHTRIEAVNCAHQHRLI